MKRNRIWNEDKTFEKIKVLVMAKEMGKKISLTEILHKLNKNKEMFIRYILNKI